MPILSVIIATYNNAPWVEACINSIMQAGSVRVDGGWTMDDGGWTIDDSRWRIVDGGWTMDDGGWTIDDSRWRIVDGGWKMEVIVVNDGSTDGTSEVLKKVQAKHPQIKVIEQENRGLSGARNRGIEEATGRYIAFVDGDDQWCPGNLPWKEMQEGEIEIFGLDLLRKDASGKVKPYRSYRPQYDKLFAPAKEFLMGRNLFPCAVSYIVKKELLDRAGIRFTTGIYHEDEDYAPRLFLAANGFMAVKGPHYLYIARENSITTGVDHARQQKRIADKLNTIERLQNLGIGQEPLHNEMQQALRCKILFLALDVIRVQLAFGATKDEIKATLHRLKELRLYPFPRYFNLRRVTTSLHYALLCWFLYLRLLFLGIPRNT